MRRLYLAALVSALCLSCAHQEIDAPDLPGDKVFYARLEQPTDPDTKVYTDENLKILWHADDRVSVFDHYTFNEEYRFTGETGDNSGTFSWVPNDDFIVGNELPGIWAVYPYQTSTKISNLGVLTVDLPAEQAYASHSFGIGANTMVSSTADNRTLFKNACGYLMLKLYGAGTSVNAITLKGNNGEPLAGKCLINAPFDGDPVLEMQAGASTQEVTLTCATPVALGSSAEDYTEFWFVLPPTTFSEGFTVTVTGSNGGTFEKSTTKSITIARNMIAHMAPFEVTFSDGSVPPNNEIWYTTTNDTVVTPYNKDGFGATLVSNTYSDGKGVMTFDGSVTKLDRNVFHYCATLKTIQIPNSVTEIGDWAFNYCFGLESFVVPESVTSLGQGCFSRCRNLISLSGKYASEDQRSLMVDQTLKAVAPKGLTSFQVVTGVVTLGEGVFAGISNLTSVTLPDGLKMIGYSAFRNCTSLPELQLPSSLVAIEQMAFEGCSSLTTIRIPESVTSISPFGVFVGCSNLASFTGKYASNDGRCLIIDKKVYAFAPAGLEEYTIPSEATSVGTMVFANCDQIKHLNYPATITAIGQVYNCNKLESIIVKAITPPSIIKSAWYGSVFQLFNTKNECPIYVPATSVDAYKTAQYWSDYADRIFPIEGDITASKYLTFTSEGTTTITLTNQGENAPVLYYSFDGTNWTQWDYSELTFTAEAPLYICGDNPEGFSFNIAADSRKYSSFSADGDKFAVSGDVMALIDRNQDVTTIPSDACFAYLFKGCKGLTSAPSLPVISLGPRCYFQMFYGCCSLLSAPELPATRAYVQCYSGMFRGCTSLISAPALPATSMSGACYSEMFYDCTSLTSAPELPATILATTCYSRMFYGCTSLTSVPELPATVMGIQSYYGMFYGCTGLTSAPNLPATTLARECYRWMFYGCTGLTSAPELPAAVLSEGCYISMFEGCNNLCYVKCLATDINASNCLDNWLYGVASTGTFIKAAGMTDWTTGSSGIPTGWMVRDDGVGGGNEDVGYDNLL